MREIAKIKQWNTNKGWWLVLDEEGKLITPLRAKDELDAFVQAKRWLEEKERG